MRCHNKEQHAGLCKQLYSFDLFKFTALHEILHKILHQYAVTHNNAHTLSVSSSPPPRVNVLSMAIYSRHSIQSRK